MPKGLYTQCVCILMEQAVPLEQVEAALNGFEVRGQRQGADDWTMGGPLLLLNYPEAENGLVAVDVVDRPWPDEMGDPDNALEIFGAWSLGQFGPFTFPGGLERAAEQSWAWDEAATVQQRHRAFIRIRSSYVLSEAEDALVLPDANVLLDEYESVEELEFVTRVAASLLELPGAFCYFNPGGEVLRDQDGLRESLNFGWANELPPLDSWSNVRLFQVNDEWSLMDSVGNSQLDLPDLEACFFSEAYDFGDVDRMLRNVTLYLLEEGEVIEDGDTVDGPGGIDWQAMIVEEPLCDPPRDVIRWIPLDDRTPPEEVLQAGEEEEGEPE